MHLGAKGEELAQQWLKEHGFEIIDRNVATKEGEVDIIARRAQGPIHFVEVKTRSTRGFGDTEAIHEKKLRRMRAVARTWLAEQRHGYLPEVLFSALIVIWDWPDAPYIEWYEEI